MTQYASRLLQKTVLLFFILISSVNVFAQTTTIRGTIKDPNGLPLQGTSVTLEGTKKGVVTDVNGNFSLSVDPGNYTVVISYVGHATQRQTVDVPAGGISDLSYNLESAGDLNRIIIVGSRAAVNRSVVQTPVPVDVISARDLQATGQVEPTQMLNFIAPSYNSSRQTIADGTDHIDPATIRGLGPDQVLVLVNGRRRYNTALLNVNGTIGRGSVGTDLNSIPPAAIERIEVLRDGASSQYGSDAIGGVVNVVMKKNNRGTQLTGHVGQHYAGDGFMRQVGLTQGLKLGKEGYLTISGDFRKRDATNRAGRYTGLVYTNSASTDEQIVQERGFSRMNNMYIGNSQVLNKGILVNAGVPLSKSIQFFITGALNRRDGEAFGFYRYPRQTTQVINDLYPDGFLPQIASTIDDRSIIAGLEGKTAGRWNWDFSQTSGGNSFAFQINKTNNATQVNLGKNAPTSFYAGKLIFNQHTTNFNISKDLGANMGLKTFNLAMGAELRFDNYQIKPGEEASYANYAPGSGRIPGAQVFPGFTPDNAVDKGRTVSGVYVDLESDLSEKFLANVAARFEHYSDFGTNLAGKLAIRYKLAEFLNFRGSVSNGFRAPSLHQRYFSNVSTVFVSTGSGLTPVQNATLRNNSAAAKSFGIPSLQAEKSMNYSIGFTSRPGKAWSITIDAYMINIKDRIVLTGAFNKAASSIVANLLSSYPDINSAAFFTNAIDTRTKGIDIVIAKSAKIGVGNLTGTLAGNFNKTEVTKTKQQSTVLSSDPSLDSKVLFNAEERGRIERGQPRNKFTLGLNYAVKKLTVNLRSTRFGEVSTIFFNTSNFQTDATRDEFFDPKIVTDASISYKFLDFLNLTIGANNIGDVYPDKLKNFLNTSDGRFVYSRNSTQFGFNGGYYYTSVVMELQNLFNKK